MCVLIAQVDIQPVSYCRPFREREREGGSEGGREGGREGRREGGREGIGR